MAEDPKGRPTKGLDERDEELAVALARVLKQPETLRTLDATSINDTLDYCLRRTRLLRMGGRSAPLVGASVIIWSAPAATIRLDVERFDLESTLNWALAIAMDPSFVWPEWGIILVGVILARFPLLAPTNLKESHAAARIEISSQVRLRLSHLVRDRRPTPQSQVVEVSRALLGEWDLRFPNGLQPVVQLAEAAWPAAASRNVSDEQIKERMHTLDTLMPAWYSEEDRTFYRAKLERAGGWLVGMANLTPQTCGDPVERS